MPFTVSKTVPYFSGRGLLGTELTLWLDTNDEFHLPRWRAKQFPTREAASEAMHLHQDAALQFSEDATFRVHMERCSGFVWLGIDYRGVERRMDDREKNRMTTMHKVTFPHLNSMRVAVALLAEEFDVPVPNLEPQTRRKRVDDYSGAHQLIQMHEDSSLWYLCHEFAHHVVHCEHKASRPQFENYMAWANARPKSHGREFQDALMRVACTAEILFGVKGE